MKKYSALLLFVLSIYFANGQAKNNKENHIEHLTTQTFKEKIFDYSKSKTWKYKGKLPAIIDFYADWCRPCKMIAPHLEELSKEYKGKLYVYKVNTDQEQELARVFGIQSIPAVLLIPLNGQPSNDDWCSP